MQMMQTGLLLLRPLAMLLRPMHDGTVADGADGWALRRLSPDWGKVLGAPGILGRLDSSGKTMGWMNAS